MSELIGRLRENWKMVLAVVAGAAVVFIVGITTESMTAVMVTGFIVGVMVGGLLTTMSRDDKRRR